MPALADHGGGAASYRRAVCQHVVRNALAQEFALAVQVVRARGSAARDHHRVRLVFLAALGLDYEVGLPALDEGHPFGVKLRAHQIRLPAHAFEKIGTAYRLGKSREIAHVSKAAEMPAGHCAVENYRAPPATRDECRGSSSSRTAADYDRIVVCLCHHPLRLIGSYPTAGPCQIQNRLCCAGPSDSSSGFSTFHETGTRPSPPPNFRV